MHRIDIDDRGKEYVVAMHLPRIREEQLVITTSGKEIRVRAVEASFSATVTDADMDIEATSASFDKTAALPSDADVERLKTVFYSGWLEIRVPKR